MNAIRLIALLISNNTLAAVKLARENVMHTLRILYLAILLPVILIVGGVLLSRAGYPGNQTMIGAGKALVVVGGLLNAALLFICWARSAIVAYIFLVVSKGLDLIPKLELPEVHREDVDSFLRWIRSWNAWIMGAALYAMILPVHRSLMVSSVVVMTWFIIAAMMSAKWFGGDRARKVLATAVGLILLGGSVLQLAPEIAPQLSSVFSGFFRDAQSWNASRAQKQVIGRSAREDRARIEAGMMSKLLDEQNDILKCSARNSGSFCSIADAKRYQEIQDIVAGLESGDYWDAASRKLLPKPRSASVRTGSGSPAPRRTETSAPVVTDVRDLVQTVPRKPVRKSGRKLTRKQLKHVYSELGKYDDL